MVNCSVEMSGSSSNEEAGNIITQDDDESVGSSEQEDSETGDDSESGEEQAGDDSIKPDVPLPSDWIEFNNTVVSMRPLFKSAKVQFANKVSRQIKAYRNRKGDANLVDKFRRKADRLVEEIQYVNRLKQDVIAKFALLHGKEEIIKIINDPESSMEYRVKAKLAGMPKISKAADEYHRLHPDWRESLIKLIKMAGWKMKKKRRKMRGKGKSKKKKTAPETTKKKTVQPKIQAEDDGTGRFDASNFPEAPPELDDLVANTDSSDNEAFSDENESDQPSVRFASFSDKGNSPEDEHPEWEEQTKSSPEKPLQTTRESGTERQLKPSKRKICELDMSKGKMSKGNNDCVTKKPFKGKTQHTIRNGSDSDGEDSLSDSEQSRTNVDPFFITSDNKEYKTLWKVEPADSFKHHDKKPTEPMIMFRNARTYEEVKNGKPPRPNRTFSKTAKNSKGNLNHKAVKPEQLHPSWQAKKKLNLATATFQGKKITFDDD